RASPLTPSSLAAQSRQRYGGSMARRYFSRFILARSSRTSSWSSRNLRNMTQVSIGRRSRSPLSPLSFRMMSRADLTWFPSRWAVVRGASAFLLPFAIVHSATSPSLGSRLRCVQVFLELGEGLPQFVCATELGRDLLQVAVLRDRRHLENVRE